MLYAQVGIGNGNASNTIQGDYNFWFLPQQEDRMNVSPGGNPGPTAYFVKYRPVFEAAPPGQPVSPDLAGRFAADFALGAQLAATSDPTQAQYLLSLARGVYAMAKTTNVGQIVTTFPYDYYPGTEWKSDMLWGAAEIALADEATGAPAAQLAADLATAARWARAYIAQGHPANGDTFNLYDNGAVAEAELLQAMQQAGIDPIAPSALLNDMAAQLRTGEDWAKGDPFALGTAAGRLRRLAARVRPVHHRCPVPEVRRLRRVRVLRAAAAELRAGRERLGQLLRGRRGHGIPALHAERDRQPGRLAHRQRRDPAGRDHRRPEQHRQLRRPGHGERDAGVQRGPVRAVQHRDRRLPRTTWSPGPRWNPPTTTPPRPCSRSPWAGPALAESFSGNPLLPRSEPRALKPAVLAIDGGNSKTDVALVASDGTLLASARGPVLPPGTVNMVTRPGAESARRWRRTRGSPRCRSPARPSPAG